MRWEGSLIREGVGQLDGAMTRLLWWWKNCLRPSWWPSLRASCTNHLHVLHSLLWQASDCGSLWGRANPWSPCLEFPA